MYSTFEDSQECPDSTATSTCPFDTHTSCLCWVLHKVFSFNPKAVCLFSDKLDGLRTGAKRKRDWEAIASRMEDFLQLPDDYDTRASEPGKKRVNVTNYIKLSLATFFRGKWTIG